MDNKPLSAQLSALNSSVLQGIHRCLEKENLRTRPYGILARTSHPAAQGSAAHAPAHRHGFTFGVQ